MAEVVYWQKDIK